MNGNWANQEQIGSNPVFEGLHAGLTVRLIATPQTELVTCSANDLARRVLEGNAQSFDFLPVVAPQEGQGGRIVGLFHAARFRGLAAPAGSIQDHFEHLSEDYLIGADASVLDFVRNADERPCRLLVSGEGIVGLVSLSDLQRLPVRAALFALITGFEITMMEAIRRRCPKAQDWLILLSPGRQEKIKEQIAKSRKHDVFIDDLLFTQFADKVTLLLKLFEISSTQSKRNAELKKIESLRDGVAHANNYADTPERAREVCANVRALLALKKQIAAL